MNTVRASRLRPGDQVELVDGAAFILRGPHRNPGDRSGLVKFDLVDDAGRRFTRAFTSNDHLEVAR